MRDSFSSRLFPVVTKNQTSWTKSYISKSVILYTWSLPSLWDWNGIIYYWHLDRIFDPKNDAVMVKLKLIIDLCISLDLFVYIARSFRMRISTIAHQSLLGINSIWNYNWNINIYQNKTMSKIIKPFEHHSAPMHSLLAAWNWPKMWMSLGTWGKHFAFDID